MRYEPITPEILKKLQAAVGPKNVTTDPDKMQPYSHDEVTDPAYHHMPEAVVFAETAEQVAAVVQLANDYHFPVVPRGAGTAGLRRRAYLRRHRPVPGKNEPHSGN